MKPYYSKVLWLFLFVFPASAALLIGCSSSGDDDASPTETPAPSPSDTPNASPTPGAEGEDFVSALSGGSYSNEDADGAPAEEGAQDDSGADEREVEEADIFVQDGDTLYILNMYRGLLILDVSDPDDPVVQGRFAITGYPVEMYIREGRAYVVVSDYFTYWRVEDAESTTSSFYGSTIAIVDVSDPTDPFLMGRVNLEGFVSQTRAVGDVIYAVSTRYAYYSCDYATDDTEDATTVVSIDISDPTDPHQVDMVSWPGSWAQVHATSNTLYVAEPDYNYEYVEVDPEEPDPEDRPDSDEPAATPIAEGGAESGDDGGPADGGSTGDPEATTPSPTPGHDDTPWPDPDGGDRTPDPGDEPEPTASPEEPTSYYVTHITYLDISDPHGAIKVRGKIDVPGQTWDKYALDEFADTFRVVTQKYDGVTSATLTVIDVSDPDNLAIMAEVDIVLDEIEWVTAARFDGERGYIVTAEQTDPLFIVDLSDPANPRLAGHVVMSGRLDHLETLGERIIALGQDNGDEGSWRFAVSLFDVSDMDDPVMLDREHIGEEADSSWSQATWDDKAFTLLPDDDDEDDKGLIAVPFTAYSYTDEGYWAPPTGGVQLLDFNDSELNKRGMVVHPGYVTRVRPVYNRLASMSYTRLLMIDIDDLDNPQVTRDLTLARNISDYAPMASSGVQLALPNWYDGEEAASIRVVPPDQPDLMSDALSQTDIDLDSGQLIELSDTLVAVAYTRYNDAWEAESWLEVYDVSDPTSPEQVSRLTLPSPIWPTYTYGWYGYTYGSTGGILVQTGSTLAYLDTAYDYYYYGYPVDTVEASEPDEAEVSEEEAEDDESTEGASAEAEATPEPGDVEPTKPPTDDEDDGEDDGEPGAETDANMTTLHIIDLSDPADPVVTSVDFDQSLFGLWADGDTLYATHAVPIEDEYGLARYYVDRVDISDPANPEVSVPINIPGTALHTPDHGDTLVTLDSQWTTSDEGYQYLEYYLYTVALAGHGAYGLDRVKLPGYVQSIIFSGEAAYALTQDYYWDVDWDVYCGYYGYPLHLRSVDLRDPKHLAEADDQRVPVSYGYLRALEEGRLFLDGYSQGMLIYDVATDPFLPEFQTSVRTSGWVMQVRARGDRAYLPAGLYGVFDVDLATP